MANKKYYWTGPHADTIYAGDYAIPVGHGMEPIALSDADLKDERNAPEVTQHLLSVSEANAEAKEGGDK